MIGGAARHVKEDGLQEMFKGVSQFCEGARAPYAPFVSLRAKRSNPHCQAIRDCFASLAMTQRGFSNPPAPASNPSPPRLQPAQWRTGMSARQKTLRKLEMRPTFKMSFILVATPSIAVPNLCPHTQSPRRSLRPVSVRAFPSGGLPAGRHAPQEAPRVRPAPGRRRTDRGG